MATSATPPAVLVFDVNETLLDITTLEPLFTRLFGEAAVMRAWFAELILYAEAVTLAGTYVSFGALGAGVLRMLGTIRGVPVGDSDVSELQKRMAGMPVHPDVPAALQRLRQAGFRLVTLTNSAPDPTGSPLDRAGLGALIERQFSIAEAKRFKPASEVYRMVADGLQVPSASLCLVAAHFWDTLGAQAAGCRAAFVARPGNAVLPVPGLPQPDIVASDMTSLAHEIVRRWG